MKIVNETGWNTADIRRVVSACCKEGEFTPPKGTVVRVVYSRSKRISGWATYGAHRHYENVEHHGRRCKGSSMLLRVPSPKHGPLNIRSFVAVVRHEVGHWRGLSHRQMSGALHYCSEFRLEDHPWAQGLTVGVQAAPKAPTRAERVSARETHAREMLAFHEAKLEREKRLVAKWRTKVRYYDKKAEAAVPDSTKMAASPAEREPDPT